MNTDSIVIIDLGRHQTPDSARDTGNGKLCFYNILYWSGLK